MYMKIKEIIGKKIFRVHLRYIPLTVLATLALLHPVMSGPGPAVGTCWLRQFGEAKKRKR